MDEMNNAEIVERLAREAERRKILEMLRECKDLEEAVKLLKALDE